MILFSVVSVCGCLDVCVCVCVCVIVNAITSEPFHKLYMAARHGKKLRRIRKWLYSDTLQYTVGVSDVLFT